MGIVAWVLPLLAARGAPPQEPAREVRFEVTFSRELAVFEFLEKLTSKAPPNPYKSAFEKAGLGTGEYAELVAACASIPLDYTYDFHEYPADQKIGGSIWLTLKRNLVLSRSFGEFRKRSIGLIPMIDLNRLVSALETIAPVYDELVYQPAKEGLERQLKDIQALIVSKKIGQYFEQARKFYRSTWDPSIPFVFVFYPLPESRGFSATAFGDLAICALPTSYEDFDGVLSVMLHEAVHVLFDEQTLEFKKELDGWFTSNPSRYSRFAYGLMNESWATAVGNGYFAEKLTGKLNPGSWYNRKYNDQMAKQLYPLIKEYLDRGKPMDKDLVDRYVAIYESKFPEWISEWDNLLAGRFVLSENRRTSTSSSGGSPTGTWTSTSATSRRTRWRSSARPS